MPIDFELGERVLIPAYSPPSEPDPDDPSTRSLWIYASDPASFGLRQPVLKVEVPYEEGEARSGGRVVQGEPGCAAAGARKAARLERQGRAVREGAARSRKPADAGPGRHDAYDRRSALCRTDGVCGVAAGLANLRACTRAQSNLGTMAAEAPGGGRVDTVAHQAVLGAGCECLLRPARGLDRVRVLPGVSDQLRVRAPGGHGLRRACRAT